ncbi:hypothetical protein BT63DRAFT_423162 [Microthyrium microscopicum]|uniref:Uncharacterized protein n=1 Tax=Microthyrium microscopicum TaxID=703497 RepID=A0A6A6UGT2_9PEZI|nr:hypothetical protein BT63DRAFT_423162 [Microthyrium microscopicum]
MPLKPDISIGGFDELLLRAINDSKDPNYDFFEWWTMNKSVVIQGRSLEEWQLDWTSSLNSPIDLNAMSPDAHLYAIHACEKIYRYQLRLMTTREGALGMGPHTASLEDQVWILFGCRVPVVLRPLENWYKLVGECYIDGYMNGEAIDEYKNGLRKKTQVTIK